MKILWIKDDKLGHLNKAYGLIDALREDLDFELVEYEIQWRWRGLRNLLPYLGAVGLAISPRCLLRNLSISNIDLIISSGGATLWLNAALARSLGVPNVLLGSPRQLSPQYYSLIGMHDPPSSTEPYFRFELIPSRMTPQKAVDMALSEGLAVGEFWGLVMGGDGEGLVWSDDDFKVLIDSFLAAAKASEKGVLLSSSRRTPVHIEHYAKQRMKELGLKIQGAWYHERKGGVSLGGVMGACELLWVTADSMSMVHEGIASGRPVLALYPGEGRLNSRAMGNYQHLIDEKRLWLGAIDELEESTEIDWNLIAGNPIAGLARAVRNLLRKPKPAI